MDVAKIRRPDSLTNLVFDEIERLILSGELNPGEPINEKALAQRLSVSRGPVREACRRLEQAGLVDSVINRGVFVRKLTAVDAGELCDLRAVLSGYAGRALARRITDAQVAVLRDYVERMEEVAAGDDVQAFYPLNSKFHGMIFEFAANRRLQTLYDSLSKELHLFRWRALLFNRDFTTSLAEHRIILDAFVQRDADVASQALESHAWSVKNRLLGSGLGG